MSRPKIFYDLITKLWPITKVAFMVSKIPGLGVILRPLFSSKITHAVMIPVNEAVQIGQNVVLPYTILEPMVTQASARFIMKDCMCRQGFNCQQFSHHIGCLYLGEGAMQINPSLGRSVTSEEALQHIQRALKEGLISLIVHTAFDAYLLGINLTRMLTVCFCCDCCCTVRYGLRSGLTSFWDTVQRLPGITVTIGEGCVECGACQQACLMNAIIMPSADHGHGKIAEQCKGCGRCIASCPVGAIEFSVDDGKSMSNHLMDYIKQYTEIGRNGQPS